MTVKIDKFVISLDANLRARLRRRLIELKRSPFDGGDIKKLKGYGKSIYVLRPEKIRIIYRTIDEKVEIIDIDFRGNIY